MKLFFTIIKSDYLQRTRSYAFLITVCASLAIAYTFVPEPNANYSTIRIADHVGYYNSAWFGYVTAIMTSIFLALIGFYLVNSGIKKDIDTKVGQIVAATPISNFKYLFSKVSSNFLVLITIVGIVFMMSVVLFILYNDGFTFQVFQFIKPYVLITVPSMFFIAVLAVVFEVFLGRYSVLQNIGFFFLFSFMMVFTPKTEAEYALDVFGTRIVMSKFEEMVKTLTNTDENTDLSIGYVIGNVKETKKFHFNGMDFPLSFLMSRLGIILLGIGIIVVVAPVFHRFNVRERGVKTKLVPKSEKTQVIKELSLTNLAVVQINYSILPLIKAELLLLFRKGSKWLWFINLGGMIALVMLSLEMAHQMVLPVLWFLQVGRLSDLTSKELTNNVHYFAFASYKPLTRLLASQIITGIILMIILALPLAIRLGMIQNFEAIFGVVLGSVFIVLVAVVLGIISKGKKLFEVLFFMLTYANINGIVFVDYFGGFQHHQLYLVKLTAFVIILAAIGFLMRKHQLKN